jgi:hypothetical protein
MTRLSKGNQILVSRKKVLLKSLNIFLRYPLPKPKEGNMFVSAVSDQIDADDYYESLNVSHLNGHSVKELSTMDPRVALLSSTALQIENTLRRNERKPMMVRASVSYENNGFKAEISAEHDFSKNDNSDNNNSSPAENENSNEVSSADDAVNDDQ